MQRLPNKRVQGFTLIELMVVIFICMLLALMVAINTDFTITDEKKAEAFSEGILGKIQLAKQIAIYQHTAVRLIVDGQRYGFQKLVNQQGEHRWVWIDNDALLKPSPIANNVAMQLQPSLTLFPNGSFTPFRLSVINKKNNIHFEILGNDYGEMELTRG